MVPSTLLLFAVRLAGADNLAVPAADVAARAGIRRIHRRDILIAVGTYD